MLSLDVILILVAFVCCLLAGLNVGVPRLSLGWLGLAAYFLSILI